MSVFYIWKGWAESVQVPSVIITDLLWALYSQGFKISKVLMSVSYSSFPHRSPFLSLQGGQMHYAHKTDKKTNNREGSNDLSQNQ